MIRYPDGAPRKRKQEIYFPILLTVLDLASVAAGLLVAYGVRFWAIPRVRIVASFLPVTEGHLVSDYLRLYPIALAVFFLAFSFVHLYRANERVWGWETAGRLARGTFLGVALFITVLFFARFLTVQPFSRWMIPISTITVPLVAGFARYGLRRELIRRSRRAGNGLARALVVGVGYVAREIARSIRRHPEFGWKVAGFLSTERSDVGREQTGIPVLGTMDDLAAVLEREAIEAVFVAQPDLRHELLGDVFIACQKRLVDVKVAPDLTEMLFTQVSAEVVDGIPFLGPRATPLQGWNVILKRLFDLIVSSVLLALFSPILLLIAILIRRDSPGPVFYRQERVGADGRRFLLAKFRTMRLDAESGSGPVFATPGDPRQTRIGRILRQTHLDELPQLANVFRGEMSLVGPRPERPFFVARFREEIPHYMARHRIKSGLTGWAQVSGQSGHEGTISERLKYDLYYIENWSLFFDLKILVLTVVWLWRRVRQLLTLPPDHPSLRRSRGTAPVARPGATEHREEEAGVSVGSDGSDRPDGSEERDAPRGADYERRP